MDISPEMKLKKNLKNLINQDENIKLQKSKTDL